MRIFSKPLDSIDELTYQAEVTADHARRLMTVVVAVSAMALAMSLVALMVAASRDCAAL